MRPLSPNNDLISTLTMGEDTEEVAHSAGGDEEAGFFVEESRTALFEGIHSWIFSIDIIAKNRFTHGSTHGLGR